VSSATVDILLYHDIARDEEEARRLSNPLFTTPLPRFKAHLQWLRRSRYKPIRLNEWLDARLQGERWQGKYVLLTFDGPHTGWFEYVFPLLVEMEIPATFFIIAGWVGPRHAFPESRHLRWEHIERIETLRGKKGKQLFDIGSHSMWHTTLDKKASENNAEYRKRMSEEIVEATRLIRNRTGCPVRTYASPEGAGDRTALAPLFRLAGLEAVRWAGYPGRMNVFMQDFWDLDISYCDTTNQMVDQLSIVLSNKWLAFFKRARRRAVAEMRQWLIRL